MKVIKTIWFRERNSSCPRIGIVLAETEKGGQAFIGIASGWDEIKDVQRIVERGASFPVNLAVQLDSSAPYQESEQPFNQEGSGQGIEIRQTRKKLSEARFFLGHLGEMSRAVPYSNQEEFQFFLSAFLSAARSVTFALQSEAKDQYDTWFCQWMAQRSKEEQDLFIDMNALRVEELHRKGANINTACEFIPITEVRYTGRGHPAYYGLQWSGPPGTESPQVGLPVHYFKLGDSQVDVVATCSRYMNLLDQMIGDFLKTHS